MMDKSEIIESVKDVISKHKGSVSEAWLFGSIASDKFHNTSDIDLAIDCSDYMEFSSILDELDRINTIRRFDVLNMSDGSFVFDNEVIRNGIKVL